MVLCMDIGAPFRIVHGFPDLLKARPTVLGRRVELVVGILPFVLLKTLAGLPVPLVFVGLIQQAPSLTGDLAEVLLVFCDLRWELARAN